MKFVALEKCILTEVDYPKPNPKGIAAIFTQAQPGAYHYRFTDIFQAMRLTYNKDFEHKLKAGQIEKGRKGTEIVFGRMLERLKVL